jgi:gluconate kinase
VVVLSRAYPLVMPSYVEFFGTPGSGKSFCAELLAENLKRDLRNRSVFSPKFDVEGPTYVIGLLVRSMLLCFGLICYGTLVFQNIKRAQFPSLKSWLSVSQNWLIVLGGYKISCFGKLVILDQGMFQLLWSAAFRVDDEGIIDQHSILIERILRLTKRRLLLVWVSANPATIHSRLSQRQGGRSPLEGAHIQRVIDAQSLAEQVKIVSKRMMDRSMITLIEIDNSKIDNGGKLKKELSELLGEYF